MRIENLETPALYVDWDIFKSNAKLLQEYANKIGIALRPHYKSHKCTAIAHHQVKNGAKGITCAKLSEAEDLVLSGIEDVLIANQIIEPAKAARAAYLAGCCRLTVCVDNVENIKLLEACATLQNTKIHCLIEYDVGMRRCGVETFDAFISLANLINTCPHLVFEGIQAYAGNIALEKDYEKRAGTAEKVEAELRDLITYAKGKGLTIKEVSGVSTGTAFLKTKNSVYTELQAGSYIFMDKSYADLNLEFKNSLFILTQVLSENSKHLIFDAGKKSISIDHATPIFVKYPEKEIVFSEEHCKITKEGVTEKIGDRLSVIPGHCCTAINLHDWLYITQAGKIIDRMPINSRGKSV